MPKRIGITVLLTALGLTGCVVLIFVLAFTAGPDAPSSLETEWVSGEGTVSWLESGGIVVQAASIEDALFILGYGQARSRAWQTVLWRQAAQGRLSEWFGPDALPVDRMIRQLELEERARAAWEALSPDEREELNRFASGIDTALSARDLNRATPFLILGFRAEPWEPWHSLAVERLFSWMSGAQVGDEAGSTDPTAAPMPDEWEHAQRRLASLLQFHGSQVNWVAGVQYGIDPYLAARFATGGSGIPFFIETDMDYGTGRFTGLMVPGTLVAPLGRTHADAWGLTARGTQQIRWRDVVSNRVTNRFHRIASGGAEEVVVAHHLDGELVLMSPSRERATQRLPVLSWPGLSAGSDTGEWLRALRGVAPQPTLLAVDGMRWSGAGWAATGRPEISIAHPSGIFFVTAAPDALSPAETVAGMPEAMDRNTWMRHVLSRAAGSGLTRILQLFPDSLVTDPREREALRYLQNWNLEYGAAEPGASIYESLLAELPDSSAGVPAARQALTRTIRALVGRYGPDMSSWRWETIQERQVRYPGADAGPADGGRTEERFLQQYLPVAVRSPGHPQSLVWGAPPSADSLRITSAWEGTLDLRSGSLEFRRPTVEYNRFLGTFMTGDRPPEIRILHRTSDDESTTFLPKR
jgi:penicillin amidase